MAVDYIQRWGSAATYDGYQFVKIGCKSTDTKPTGKFLTGSECREVDTGKLFYYDRATDTWIDPTA